MLTPVFGHLMRKSAGLSVADETKRMTCRVCIDPPAARAFADVEQRGAEPQDLFVGLIEILDPQVEVELLWASGVRPTRREMVFHALERPARAPGRRHSPAPHTGAWRSREPA